MDAICIKVLILFLVANILVIVEMLRFGGKPTSGYSYLKWTQLDPDYLKMTFESRTSWLIFDDLLSCLSSISLFALFLPIFQVSWILSRGGKHRIVRHLSIFLIALAGGLGELMASLMVIGARTAAHRINSSPLDNWMSGDTKYYEDDGVGRRVFEIVYLMAIGSTTWVDAFEWLCLSLVFMILYFEMKTSHTLKREGEITFEPCLATLGLVISYFAFFEFLAQLARAASWNLWTTVSFYMLITNLFILLPCWLVLLGGSLPQIRTSFQNRQEEMPLREVDSSLTDGAPTSLSSDLLLLQTPRNEDTQR